MHTRIFSPRAMNADLWSAMHALRDANSAYDDPMFDPDLARILSDVRDDTRIVVVFDADVPVAFWPLHIRSGWSRPLGGPFSDWHAPLLARGAAIQAEDILRFAGIGGMTVHGLKPSGFGDLPDHRQREMAHMTNLAGGLEQYLSTQTALYPKYYKKMRRLSRNLARDHSEIVFTFDDADPAAAETLLTRKSQQFRETGRHDVLAPAWARNYVDRLRRHQGPRFRVVLSTLRIDGELAAAELNMQSDTVLHSWLTGFDRKFASWSPGLMLSDHIIGEMPQRGLMLYDCGPGLAHYKKYLANFAYPVETGIVPGGRSRSPARLMAHGWRAAERSLPAPVTRLMGKTRRRFDQILLAETDFVGRAKGVLTALGANSV